MVKRLNLSEQRKLYGALPASRKNMVKKHCRACAMRGEGLGKILKSTGKVLGPVAKEIGPTVMKEIVVPLLREKMKSQKGKGLTLPGGGLKLAGQK